MSKAAPDTLAAVRQDKRRQAIDDLFAQPWVLLYRDDGEEAWYSCLLQPERAEQALRSTSWELGFDDIRPSIVQYGATGDYGYERFPRDGAEPLVLVRYGEHATPEIEVAEELRLFLNLFRDGKGQLYRVTASGTREIVVRIGATEVSIRQLPLRAYLRARQMILAVFFDHICRFPEVAVNPLPEADREMEVRDTDRTWGFGTRADWDGLMSRLCGKRLLIPEPRDYDKQDIAKRAPDFIIGYDKRGRPVEHSADPDKLASRFGANPDAPHYLTPVWFTRDVLNRYYHDPGRYMVADGSVRAGIGWVLPTDDDHPDHVVVFLGDLGRGLPYGEQLHWRIHNVPPEGSLSQTAIARSFEAHAADGEQPEHLFKAAYRQLADAWRRSYGWRLFRPLPPGDTYLLARVHIPTTDNPAELDAQILGMTKILVDSLDDGKITSSLGGSLPDEKSLSKLDRYLKQIGYPEVQRDIAVLRSIQGLRSSGIAHMRGSNYEKSLRKLGLDGRSASVVVGQLMGGVITMLEGLRAHAAANTQPVRGGDDRKP